MKNSLSKLLAFNLCVVAPLFGQGNSGKDEWTVTLIQKHLTSTGVFQGGVAREGSQVSFAPIPEGGSEFTLWAYRDGPNGLEEHLVDNEVVGAYLPEGEVWVTTEDPYTTGIPRTRIDKGFTLNYEIKGLESGEDAPDAAKKVLLDHKVAAAIGDPKESNLGDDVDVQQSFIDQNGVRSFDLPANILLGTDIYESSGIEKFKLYALSDAGVAELELSSAQVQVWPLAKASFSGVSDSSVYTIAPEVSVDLVNLYPDSETWVQVYPGPAVPGTTGTRLTETFALVKDDKPRNSVLKFTQLDRILSENGEWTLEVVTRTPFGVESITNVSVLIDRDLKLRGSFQALTD